MERRLRALDVARRAGAEALLASKDITRARRYSAKERFAADEVLDHPVFGIGLVQEVRGDKIAVAFKADVKTLVHGKA